MPQGIPVRFSRQRRDSMAKTSPTSRTNRLAALPPPSSTRSLRFPRARADKMSKAGFDIVETNRVTVFLDRDDPMPSRGLRVVSANKTVEPHDPYPAPPVRTGIIDPDGCPTIDLRELLILRLIPFCRIDQVRIAASVQGWPDRRRFGWADSAVASAAFGPDPGQPGRMIREPSTHGGCLIGQEGN